MSWYLGHHLFQHSESAPLELVYEVTWQRIRVIWGQSPPEKIDFKLDRDAIRSVMVIYIFIPLFHMLSDSLPDRE